MGKKNSSKDFLMGAIVGGLIGATTALFLTPKSGQELRQKVNEQASVVKEKTNNFSKNFSDQSNQIINKVKERTISPNLEISNIDSKSDEQKEQPENNPQNDRLFQEKLEEAQRILMEAESGLNQ